MTAEFAVTLPVVLAVAGLLIAVLVAGNSSASVHEAARAGAREAARGASEASVARAVERASPGSEWSRSRSGEFEEIRVSRSAVQAGPWRIGEVQAVAAVRAEELEDSAEQEQRPPLDAHEHGELP